MDNFYCDPHLFLQPERKKMLACGTIRANRKGFPKTLCLHLLWKGGWIVEITYGGAMKIWLPWRGIIDTLCIWSPSSSKHWWTNHSSASFCWWSPAINTLSPSTICLPGMYGWSWLGWPNSAELFRNTVVQQSLEKAVQLWAGSVSPKCLHHFEKSKANTARFPYI